MKRFLLLLLTLVMVLSLVACGNGTNQEAENTSGETTSSSSTGIAFDDTAWNYDADNDVYWQIGVAYCEDPAASEYESLGIYVPGAYMSGTENDNGTYTCSLNTDGYINGYTAETAPIVMPVNTAGYSAQSAPTSYSYSGISSYIEAGFIYVYAGCRGRDNGYDSDGNLSYSGGAPWGVTDLKAAVRYLRYNDSALPGDTDRIFTFGHSGGGAQSSLMGATGDSELYYDYLESIGAAMYDDDGNYISDAIAGAMCWCPITSLDYANEAYEWMMGQYSTIGTRSDDTWTSALSDDLSVAYAEYINDLGLTDEDGTVLTLSESDSGIYASGTYYDYLLSEIQNSLNNFLSDTEFPYTSGGSSEMADGGFAGGGVEGEAMPSGDLSGEMPSDFSGEMPSDMGEMPSDFSGEMPSDMGEMPSDFSGEMPSDMGEMPSGFSGEMPSDMGEMPSGFSGEMPSDMSGDEDIRGGGSGGQAGRSTESVTYETVQDYIDSLNSDTEWIIYDETTNTATITSVEAFISHCKNASKDVGAFDDLNRSQAENKVFGDDENDALHFDSIMASVLENNQDNYSAYSDWDKSYVEAYQEYIDSVDSLGNTSLYRQNMYNPMYFISDYYDGYGSSTVAAYWRINTGITQGDTATTVEMNLALALEQFDGVESVDFETVWDQGHTTAERTGDSTTNFIEWVNECLG